MWEHAMDFGAALVWAEHRYYGASQPFGVDSWSIDPTFLTSRQAMADYAFLLQNLTREWGAAHSPVVAFGGSYGGMLAAWMRRHYPHIVAGAVAASAPVGQFPGVPGFRPSRFWEIVTQSATPAAGAPADCAPNVREAFARLFDLGRTAGGRAALSKAFRLCKPLGVAGGPGRGRAGRLRGGAPEGEGAPSVFDLAYWVQGAFDAYAMGAYPFPSSYMGGTDDHPLPAWPMRAACAHMTRDTAWLRAHAGAGQTGESKRRGGVGTGGYGVAGAGWQALGAAESGVGALGAGAGIESSWHTAAPVGGGEGDWLLVGLREAAAVLYNATQDKACYDVALEGPAAGNAGAWDWQVCTEFMGQELPYFPATGTADMFWDQGPFDLGVIRTHCLEAWGVEPVPASHVTLDGGLDYRFVTNIVFTNGLLDPWSAFGVLERPEGTDASIDVVLIPDGGHHVDLMFSRTDDSPTIRGARARVLESVRRWIDGARTGVPAVALA